MNLAFLYIKELSYLQSSTSQAISIMDLFFLSSQWLIPSHKHHGPILSLLSMAYSNNLSCTTHSHPFFITASKTKGCQERNQPSPTRPSKASHHWQPPSTWLSPPPPPFFMEAVSKIWPCHAPTTRPSPDCCNLIP